MATKVTLPELGENIESGTITKVLVEVGDEIEADQPIVEVESEKATVEVPSTEGGKVSEIKVKEGQEIKVGAVILVLDGEAKGETKKKEAPKAKAKDEEEEPDEEEKPAAKKKEAPEEKRKSKPEKKKPAAKKAEAKKEAEEEEAEEGSDDQEDEAAAEEELREDPNEEEVEEIEEGVEAAEEEEKPKAAKTARAAEDKKRPPIAAAPSVRRLARQIGVDIYKVEPSSGDRVTAEDVKAYAKGERDGSSKPAPKSGAALPSTGPLPDFKKWGKTEREPMSGIRKRTAERLAAAWVNIPHVTQHDKADITEIEAFRKQYGKTVEKAGGKLTVTAILAKAVVGALKEFPQFNASLDMNAHEIIYKHYYNIGIAVDTENGLLVPVIRDADEKTITEIAVELSEISEKARARKLTIEQMQGASFTITNLGGIGGIAFTPIINPPEVAILGVSRGVMEPVYRDGQFEPRMMMPISLSYDHRIIDGAAAARFARWLCESLEQPLLISL